MGKREDQGNKLLDAAEAGDADVVNSLIKDGVDLEYICDMSWTALIYASQEGHLNIVQALVNAGANVLYETPKGKSALTVAKNQAIKTILETPQASVSKQTTEVKGEQVSSIQEGEFSFADMIAADQAKKEASEKAASSNDGVSSVRSFVSMTILCDSLQGAFDFYVGTLGFNVVQDSGGTDASRTLVISAAAGSGNYDIPTGTGTEGGALFLLCVAKTNVQRACIGKQCGDGIMGTVHTNQLSKDYEDWVAKGVTFTQEPQEGACGTVAVFEDLYGNKFELVDTKRR